MTTTLSDLFDQLRLRAEADTADAGADRRRPSWAPALVLSDEIVSALVDLNHPLSDKKVAQLWATFSGRDKEVRVQEFELRLGTERSGLCLLSAKRGSFGLWDVDTARIGFPLPSYQEFLNAENEYKHARSMVDYYKARLNDPIADPEREHARDELAHHKAILANIEQAKAERAAARARHQLQLNHLGDLIKQRVADFSGDPLTQMVEGAHATGNCAICGRLLTDPHSIAKGIGPECATRGASLVGRAP